MTLTTDPDPSHLTSTLAMATDPPAEAHGQHAFRQLNALIVQHLTAAAKPPPPSQPGSMAIDPALATTALAFLSHCLVQLADQWALHVRVAYQSQHTPDQDQNQDQITATALVGAATLFCTSIAGLSTLLSADLVHDRHVIQLQLVACLVDSVSEPVIRLTATCLSPTLHAADHDPATAILSRTLSALGDLLTLLCVLDKHDQNALPDPLASALAHLLVQLPPLTLASRLDTAPFWSAVWPTTTTWLCARFAHDPLYLRDLVTSCLLPTLRPSNSTADLDPRFALPPAFWHSLSHLIPSAFPNPTSTGPVTRGHANLPDPDSELAHRANVYLDLLDHVAAMADHPRSATLVPTATLTSLLTTLTHLLSHDALVELLVVNDAYGVATVRALTLAVTRHYAAPAAHASQEWQAFVRAVDPLMATSIPGLATVPSVLQLAGLVPEDGAGARLVMGKWAWLVAQLLLVDQAAEAMVTIMMNGAPHADDDDDDQDISEGTTREPDRLGIVDELLDVVDLLAHDVFVCPCCCLPPSTAGSSASSWVWDESISALVAPIVKLDLHVERFVPRWIRSMLRHLIQCRHTSTAHMVLASFAVAMECVQGHATPAAVQGWMADLGKVVQDPQHPPMVRQRLEALGAVVGAWGATGVGV